MKIMSLAHLMNVFNQYAKQVNPTLHPVQTIYRNLPEAELFTSEGIDAYIHVDNALITEYTLTLALVTKPENGSAEMLAMVSFMPTRFSANPKPHLLTLKTVCKPEGGFNLLTDFSFYKSYTF